MGLRFFLWLQERRAIVLMGIALLASAGVLSVFRVAVDAFPDVSPVSVTILTEAPGMSPLEVEQQIRNNSQGYQAIEYDGASTVAVAASGVE